jgi:hypothetical protein
MGGENLSISLTIKLPTRINVPSINSLIALSLHKHSQHNLEVHCNSELAYLLEELFIHLFFHHCAHDFKINVINNIQGLIKQNYQVKSVSYKYLKLM